MQRRGGCQSCPRAVPPRPDSHQNESTIKRLLISACGLGRKTYAQCYGGHQFGYWAGQLGDGRAISLGEVTGPSGRFELQLKARNSAVSPFILLSEMNIP